MKNLDIKSTFLKFGDFQKKGHNDKETDARHIKRIESAPKSIFLTFDMCPSHKLDTDIIDWLIDNQIKASFFMNVNWLNTNFQTTNLSFVDSPLFTIGGHGYNHIDTLKQSNEEQSEDIHRAYDELNKRLKEPIKWYRVPFGHPTDTTFKVLRELGLKCASWAGPVFDRRTGDSKKNNEKEYQSYVNLSLRGGDIVILHANGTGINTLEILKNFAKVVKERGYTFDKLPNV
jgi:peptidoglycan/xylan/chitin deacetylase (PgdA/CDA1 family)